MPRTARLTSIAGGSATLAPPTGQLVTQLRVLSQNFTSKVSTFEIRGDSSGLVVGARSSAGQVMR